MCGEKYCCTLIACRNWGSPPHVRGKEVLPSGQSAGARITPAYAGKSAGALKDSGGSRITPACAGRRWCADLTAGFPRDHPRMCGEKSIICWVVVTPMGSPPHVRGKDFSDLFKVRMPGITPAHAGKSSVRELLLIVSRDHPRTCGEKAYKSVIAGSL